MILIARVAGFPVRLLAMVISFPISGALIMLFQATLMHLNRGREPQMMARYTASAPGKSGTVVAIGSVFGLFGGGIAWLIEWFAYQVSLPVAMWLLLLGPVCLILLVPRPQVTRQL